MLERCLIMLVTFQTFRCLTYNPIYTPNVCTKHITSKLRQEIASYLPLVNQIIERTTKGSYKGITYAKLADFVDKFGARPLYSPNLDESIDYLLNETSKLNLSTSTQQFEADAWKRGEESLKLLKPFEKQMALLGLGGSVETNGTLTAQLVAFDSLDLALKAPNIKNKIVLLNPNLNDYGAVRLIRMTASSILGNYGVKALLVRSIATKSLYTPHTGSQHYKNNKTNKIPAACITIEDAELLKRLTDKNVTITVQLKMTSQTIKAVKTRNTFITIPGSTQPNKQILFGGHLDSWDVGSGVVDDATGVFLTLTSLQLLQEMNLVPQRSLVGVFWSGEELGELGAHAYVTEQANEVRKVQVALESDLGVGYPLGLAHNTNEAGGCLLGLILKLFGRILPRGGERLQAVDHFNSDIDVLGELGVPTVGLWLPIEEYFMVHHSMADSFDKVDEGALDACTALWASVVFILGNLSVDFPRDGALFEMHEEKIDSAMEKMQVPDDVEYFIQFTSNTKGSGVVFGTTWYFYFCLLVLVVLF